MRSKLPYLFLFFLPLLFVGCGDDSPKLTDEAQRFVGTWTCVLPEDNSDWQYYFICECLPELYFKSDGTCGGEVGVIVGSWFEGYNWEYSNGTLTTDLYGYMHGSSTVFYNLHVEFYDITWIDENTWQGYLGPQEERGYTYPSVFNNPYTFSRKF